MIPRNSNLCIISEVKHFFKDLKLYAVYFLIVGKLFLSAFAMTLYISVTIHKKIFYEEHPT